MGTRNAAVAWLSYLQLFYTQYASGRAAAHCSKRSPPSHNYLWLWGLRARGAAACDRTDRLALTTSSDRAFVISGGIGLLVAAALVLTLRSSVRKPVTRDSKVISLGCLLLFTTSFVHFGYGHPASAWTAEIAWHHASIPLVLFVLLQDYRFLLLDVFFRFLLNFGLAAAYAASALVLNQRWRIWARMRVDEFWMGVGLVGLCVALISFAFLRAVLQRWLTRRLFRRGGLDECTKRLAGAGTGARTEEEVLAECAAALAGCISAHPFVVQRNPLNLVEEPAVTGRLPRDKAFESLQWVQAVVPLRFSRGDSCQVLLGARSGGRR